MWKEKYEALKVEFDQLRAAHDALAERIQVSVAAGETVFHGSGEIVFHGSPPRNGDLENVYRYIVDRAAKEDPKTLATLVSRPELVVSIKRQVIEANGGTLRGALAILISEKYFDGVREFADTRKELIRRGFLGGKAPNLQISQALTGLVELGFLTKEETGYQAVVGMKVRIREA